MSSLYTYMATVTQRRTGAPGIHDGDTVWLDIDAGFGTTIHLGPCRLYRIDAPEVFGADKQHGIAATGWLCEQLRSEPFMVKTYAGSDGIDAKGKYGRWLVEIFRADGACINDLMVDAGMAVYKDY